MTSAHAIRKTTPTFGRRPQAVALVPGELVRLGWAQVSGNAAPPDPTEKDFEQIGMAHRHRRPGHGVNPDRWNPSTGRRRRSFPQAARDSGWPWDHSPQDVRVLRPCLSKERRPTMERPGHSQSPMIGVQRHMSESNSEQAKKGRAPVSAPVEK